MHSVFDALHNWLADDSLYAVAAGTSTGIIECSANKSRPQLAWMYGRGIYPTHYRIGPLQFDRAGHLPTKRQSKLLCTPIYRLSLMASPRKDPSLSRAPRPSIHRNIGVVPLYSVEDDRPANHPSNLSKPCPARLPPQRGTAPSAVNCRACFPAHHTLASSGAISHSSVR